jgi:hypothetical protein
MMLANWRRMQTFNAVQPEPTTAAPPKAASPVVEAEAKAESSQHDEETLDKYDLCYLACTD